MPSPAESRALAPLLDSTLLHPSATEDAIEALCSEARRLGFAAVCVNGCYVATCARLLAGSGVGVAAVVGFPLGAMARDAKVAEARIALADGASELDVVINLGALCSGRDRRVTEDLRGVVREAHGSGALLKVILECSLLDDETKRRACRLACDAGVDFVKTSTGFGGGGATVADVRLLARAVAGCGREVRVKAAGGIRTAEEARAMVGAGASRIGTSSAATIALADAASRGS